MRYVETVDRSADEILLQFNPKKKRNGRVPQHVMLKKNKRAFTRLCKLNDTEYRLFTTLFRFVGWETNIVVGDGEIAGEKGVPLTWPEIDALLNMDRRTRYKIQAKLEKSKYIGYIEVAGKRTAIIIHPDFVQFGRKVDEQWRNAFASKKNVEGEEIKID